MSCVRRSNKNTVIFQNVCHMQHMEKSFIPAYSGQTERKYKIPTRFKGKQQSPATNKTPAT